MAGAGAAVGAGGQSPQLTGGAGGASGDIRSETGIDFGTLNVGGLFSSGATSSQASGFTPLIVGGVLLLAAFMFFQQRRRLLPRFNNWTQ